MALNDYLGSGVKTPKVSVNVVTLETVVVDVKNSLKNSFSSMASALNSNNENYSLKPRFGQVVFNTCHFRESVTFGLNPELRSKVVCDAEVLFRYCATGRNAGKVVYSAGFDPNDIVVFGDELGEYFKKGLADMPKNCRNTVEVIFNGKMKLVKLKGGRKWYPCNIAVETMPQFENYVKVAFKELSR